MCDLGYCHTFLLSTAGVDGMELSFQPSRTSRIQQESMTISKAAHTILLAPDYGQKYRPKHVDR
jgi:hypothetical protein